MERASNETKHGRRQAAPPGYDVPASGSGNPELLVANAPQCPGPSDSAMFQDKVTVTVSGSICNWIVRDETLRSSSSTSNSPMSSSNAAEAEQSSSKYLLRAQDLQENSWRDLFGCRIRSLSRGTTLRSFHPPHCITSELSHQAELCHFPDSTTIQAASTVSTVPWRAWKVTLSP